MDVSHVATRSSSPADDEVLDEVYARRGSACWLERRAKSFKMPWDNRMATMHECDKIFTEA